MNTISTMKGSSMTRYPRAIGAVVVASALMLGATACAQAEPENTDPAAPPAAKITVAVPFGEGNPAAIPLWAGEELGYFEEENIEVEVVSLAGRPAETVGLVVAGQADLVIAASDTLIVPASNGNDQGLAWIFTPYQRPTFAIAVADDSDIKTAGDLTGTTIGMSALGAPFETFARGNVEADGGDGSSITPVAVAGAAAFESMNKGDVDAVVANRSEIALAGLATGVESRILDLPDRVAQNFAAGFLMRNASTDAEMDGYARFLRSYIKAAVFSQENPEAAVQMNWDRFPASKTSGLSEEENMEQGRTVLLATVNEFVRAEDGQWGYIAPERWEAYVDYLGLSDKIDDITSLYNHSLLEEINDFDEDAVRTQAAEFGK